MAIKGDFWTEEYRVLYSDRDNGRNRVGFILNRVLGCSVTRNGFIMIDL